MNSVSVEYDFKKAKLDLFKNGKLKRKYNCLPYMITLPLSTPLNPLPPPVQPNVSTTSVLNSTNNTDGWMNFTTIQNGDVISLENNTILINNYGNNYDVTVNVINKGDSTVPLRFMFQNFESLMAANMNDIYGNETVFNTNNQQIKFTITGEYQFFYVNYPTTNYNINITISVSHNISPELICTKKCKKCTCYDINGKGYIVINQCKEKIKVPVYKTKVIGGSVNKYLYPEFGYLRDLFYNVTLANSLPPPINLNLNLNALTPTVINCGFQGSSSLCLFRCWGIYTIVSGNDVVLTKTVNACGYNQIYEKKSDQRYRYSWPDTPSLVTSTNYPQEIYMYVYLYHAGSWHKQNEYWTLNRLDSYRLYAGSYDSFSGYQWIAFGLVGGETNAASINPSNNTFNITITEI